MKTGETGKLSRVLEEAVEALRDIAVAGLGHEDEFEKVLWDIEEVADQLWEEDE